MATIAATSTGPSTADAQQLRAGQNRVTFQSEGETLVGSFFLPTTFTPGAKLPVVVVTGSWLTVKEQMPNHYARRLADRGIAAMTFDFRGFGESGGGPRGYESPERKITDIHSAAAFARSLGVAEDDNVGGLAICASAGYMAHAIARGAPLKAFATVAAWFHDAASLPQVYGGEEGVRARLEAGRKARAAFDQSGKVSYVPAYEPDNPKAAMFFPLDYYGRKDRGAVPEWENRFAELSWPEWLAFDGVAVASRVSVPTLMVHSDDSAYPDNARRFHAALGGAKQLVWTKGQQIDFYDRDPQVAEAVAAVSAHFGQALRSGATPADRLAVSDVVTSMVHDLDAREWEKVRAAFAAEVDVDYTSLAGGEPARMSGEKLIASWRELVPGFESTQHLLGPVVVEVAGDRAVARTHVRATHLIPGATGGASWVVGGHYTYQLVRSGSEWKIAGTRLVVAYQEGNLGLADIARAKGARAAE